MTDVSHMSTTGLILSNVKPVDLLLIAKKPQNNKHTNPKSGHVIQVLGHVGNISTAFC